MNFHIIIPAHNEEAYLEKTLQSLVSQTLLPKKIVVVNDHSTDGTQAIINQFTTSHSFIFGIETTSKAKHEPGSKIIHAFNEGLESLDDNYDVVCKFDADLIFPKNYLEKTARLFEENPNCGIAGGFCYIQKKETWILESLTNKDHVRGALKAYRKDCFKKIGGLKSTMGWDTVDELLAQYHGWEICTDETLHVKHLKPTGKTYTKASRYKQGEAFYKLRYGFVLTSIASAKLSFKKKSISYFIDCIRGYLKAKKNNISPIVSEKEGVFIRNLRWKGIKKKLL
ncbi:MAG TPA: glycosyl transferase family 2 [Flavobacteriaceae bacterium]|nr:glycosyl transferase family 2 [Flavobacteriaceae bacterium]